MRRKFASISLLVGFVAVTAIVDQSFGDNAEVLPKGIFRTHVTGNFYSPVTKRFDPDGNEEDLAVDFNATLNSNIFPSLSFLEAPNPILPPFLKLPPGTVANVGRSVVSFEQQFYDLIMGADYGLTDTVSIGIRIPYLWNRNQVEARLNSTGANVGLNPLFGTPLDPFKIPLIPLTVRLPNGQVIKGVPLTANQVKALLGPGLDVNGDGKVDIPGFGYKPFRTFDESGISDVEIGARYQYFKTDDWRLAFTGGVRFPTGTVDDTDNLVDVGFGTGAYDLLFRLNNDYTGIKNLVLNATFRYDLYLPDTIEKRVPSSVDRPITSDREKVDRDIGDVIELETSATYNLFEGLSASLLYRYGFKFKDDVDGNKGFVYSSLEDETNSTYHMIQPGITYSTIPLFKAKQFPLPLDVTFSYSNVFAGSNRYLKQEFFTLSISGYF
jgi:hypothetical protein